MAKTTAARIDAIKEKRAQLRKLEKRIKMKFFAEVGEIVYMEAAISGGKISFSVEAMDKLQRKVKEMRESLGTPKAKKTKPEKAD